MNEASTATELQTRTKYTYDGDGRRVAKVGSKLYWYGAGSEILAETNSSGTTTNEYIYFGDKRVALLPSGSTAQFYVEDSLGSSRIMTSNTGVVCYDADFTPYGGERAVTNSCAQNNYKFEGKERDTETGNDDFGARFYNNRFGRWLSSDWSGVPAAVPYANFSNPQTLNLYSIVDDDPATSADLDGHCCDTQDVRDAYNAGIAVLTALATFAETAVATGGGGVVVGAEIESFDLAVQYPHEPCTCPVDAVNPPYIEAPLQNQNTSSNAKAGTRTKDNSQTNNQSTSSTGPKAKDAAGVTAGGQATDKDGNKLGPSGDKQINKTRSNTREAANNKAKNEGSGSVEHPNPKRGNPHFHPTTKYGKKQNGSTHHEYPR